jgi:hypothetical protein
VRIGLRLRRALSTDARAGYVAALRRIEATGSGKQKAFARLMLAHEWRDWDGLLVLARAQDVDFSEAKPREIRALGELGHLDEMVRTYADAEKWLGPQSRQECSLFVLAFAGRVEAVQQLLDGALSGLDDETKAYWIAVARLRADPHDEVARATLRRSAKPVLQTACDGALRSSCSEPISPGRRSRLAAKKPSVWSNACCKVHRIACAGTKTANPYSRQTQRRTSEGSCCWP